MEKRLYTVSDEEKYYFDLRGYLVVEGVLSAAQIQACNEAIDRHGEEFQALEAGRLSKDSAALRGTAARRQLEGMLGWPEPDREPFRELLVHPTVVSRLTELSGTGFRLDHGPVLMTARKGTEGHWLHGGGEPFEPAVWYHQQNGRITCRGITVAWQLADTGPGHGGFACVPGSHQANEPAPRDVRSVDDDMGLVEQPVMKAGDVLLFAETMTHGALPWTAAHERRALLYKYTSRAAARAVGKHFTPAARHGDWVEELTPEQQAVLYGPGVHHGGRLPILESDGERVWVVGDPN